MPKRKRAKKKVSGGVFQNVKCVIGNCYLKKTQDEIRRLIEGHGGVVVKHPSKKAGFLVQSWSDEPCDERLQECCENGMDAVPPNYLRACVEKGEMIPFRTWAVGGYSTNYMNPSTNLSLYTDPVSKQDGTPSSKCLLGVTALGNVDERCREVEELNQTYQDYAAQGWPSFLQSGARTKLCILPIVDKTSKPAPRSENQYPSPNPDDPKLLEACRQFLSSYFGTSLPSVEFLKPVPLYHQKKKLYCEKLSVRTAKNGNTRLLNALDLLDVAAQKLPDDCYCILGITNQDIYEYDDGPNDPAPEGVLHGDLRGRAFGGSRIAVFSTASYGRSLNESCYSTAKSFAYQLATMAHETMHCFGLDHCGLYGCCMNSWSDEISEFAVLPNAQGRRNIKKSKLVKGCIHLCPICVRKLQYTCGFDLKKRYEDLESTYESIGLEEQKAWCTEVLRVGGTKARQTKTGT